MTYRTPTAFAPAWIALPLLLATAPALFAQLTNFATLVSFGSPSVPGESPHARLALDIDGSLWGTTQTGGANVDQRGTVFRVRRDGTRHGVVHNFLGGNADGELPLGEILLPSDGKLYGTTANGGAAGRGTVFKVNRDGSGFMILHHFPGPPGGEYPNGGLIEARNGMLYGTTVYGGDTNCNFVGCGTLFKVRKDGTGFTLVYLFNDDFGREPYGTPIEASDGALYCTTTGGGAQGLGTLFRINLDGTGPSVVRQFGSGTDGHTSYSTLLEDTDLFLCGTTFLGGSNNLGTVFRVDKQGNQYTVLHHFEPGGDGSLPYGGLVQGADGALYGTTQYGGHVNRGTIFKVRKDGTGYRVLHSFAGETEDGWRPYAALLLGPDDAFYGTTSQGGTDDRGVIFRLGHALRLTPMGAVNHLAFTGVPGYTYELQRSTDLANWITIRTATVDGGIMALNDPAPRPGAVFYRLWLP